jgi:hypothetical protein
MAAMLTFLGNINASDKRCRAWQAYDNEVNLMLDVGGNVQVNHHMVYLLSAASRALRAVYSANVSAGWIAFCLPFGSLGSTSVASGLRVAYNVRRKGCHSQTMYVSTVMWGVLQSIGRKIEQR